MTRGPAAYRIEPEPDAAAVAAFLRDHWGESFIVTRGRVWAAEDLFAFRACDEAGAVVGLATFAVVGDGCELVSLDSLAPGGGIGTALVEAVADAARAGGARWLRVVTTNDNLSALGFYQRRGFRIVGARPGAVEAARRLKPTIPLLGEGGIPIRDEIDLETSL